MLVILNLLNTPHFLLFTISIALVIKSILLYILIPQAFKSPSTQKTCIFLITVLIGSMAGEVSWQFKLFRYLFAPIIPYSAIIFFIRIAWACLIIQYQSLGLFLDSLTERKFQLNLIQKSLLILSSTVAAYYIYLAFFDTSLVNETERSIALSTMSPFTANLEITVMRHTVLYILPILTLPNLFLTIRRIRSKTLPKILHHQLDVIIRYLMVPYFIAELLIALNFEFKALKLYTNAIVGISALLITYIVYYCINRVMGMRFLNFTNHVESKHTFNFVDDFKIILEQLSVATTTQELTQITGTFFKQAFNIPSKKTNLYLRSNLTNENLRSTEIDTVVEEFCSTHNQNVCAFINQNKIIIFDELMFSNFYEEDQTRTSIIHFLQKINADVFLPIFEKERIIAYIVIESNARPKHLYSNVERDEMLVFASYLSNIINLLQNRNLESLILQEKELKEELYKKHQEINQYKESIRSFLKNSKHKEIGIIFYKYRRFIFANQTAKEMIKINVNTQEGHPISRALKQVARQVEEYKAPQTMMVKDVDGSRLVISGVLNLEQNNVILIISYPDIADIITKQINLLKDPTKWDYLLYLETTKPGQLINQLIPGTGETLLNFKINLLQTALSKKATLLETAAEDLMPMVELLHHVSMRDNLHVIKLQGPTNPFEMAAKLFGINPIYGAQTPAQKPILEKLDGNGTLFIQNVEYLDKETQEYLAEFIQYGYYRVFKSDHKISANVRIICSTNQNLQILMQEGNFLPSLFNEFKKCTICVPSLLELPDLELHELAQGYTEQAIQTNDFKNLLELSEKEKSKLIGNRPVSLQELKTKVQQILVQKSKKNNIEQEIHFDPAYEITDPELVQASRLGKYALRDHKMMVMLWNKFKNQNKIAAFLGVNRSSVNRRCREYNLEM